MNRNGAAPAPSPPPLPEPERHALAFTDFWEAPQKAAPEGQHVAFGKGSGQTNHVERLNNTLRQRLSRLVRKTLSSSKSEGMYESCLQLFLHHCNTKMARGASLRQQRA